MKFCRNAAFILVAVGDSGMHAPKPTEEGVPERPRRKVLDFPELPPEIAEETREHLALIGLVAATWAQFEADLDTYTIGLGRIPAWPGRCLAAQVIGPARKLDAYIAIARRQGADRFMGELEKFAKATTRLAERRNRVVHDPRLKIGAGTASRLESTARRRLRYELVGVPLDEMEALVREIRAHEDDLIELHARIEQHAAIARKTAARTSPPTS
jgi:hypothetical protein